MDEIDHAQDEANRQSERILADCRRRNAAAPAGERPGLRVCVDCPDPIEAARIAASPTAIRCTACQAEAEARFRTPFRRPGAAA